MIKSLRRRFMAIAMLSLLLTLVVLMAGINLFHWQSTLRRVDGIIQVLHEHNGGFPAPEERRDLFNFQITAETPFETRFFVVKLDAELNTANINIEHIAALTPEVVEEYTGRILAEGKASGSIGQYRYGLFDEEDGGKTIVVVDMFLQTQSVTAVLQITLLVAGACIVLVFLLLVYFSGRAVLPYVRNIEKQQRFITDASHELKTPLSIISANTDVLEITGGENQWTQSTRNQVQRLNRLVQSLVELAKMDEDARREDLKDMNFSSLVSDTAGAFAPVLEGHGHTLRVEIEPELRVEGAQDSLSRLISILLDNADKYASAQSEIGVSLQKTGRYACLRVTNPVEQIEEADPNRLFDRFYRADASRNQSTRGYGIGLSVAQAIVEYHRGKISAEYEKGSGIAFRVLLPLT